MRRFVLFGLVVLIWFGALHQALYDDWTAVVAFLIVTLLAVAQLEIARRMQKPLQFPLLIPWLLWLAAVWASVYRSFDVTTSLWEAWAWTFCMVAFYLTANAAKTLSTGARERMLKAAGLIVIPLSLMAIRQQLTGAPRGYGTAHFPLLGTWHYGHWEIHATLLNSIVFAGFLFSWAYIYRPLHKGRAQTDILPFTLIVTGMLLARSWTIFGGFLFGLALCHSMERKGHAQDVKRWLRCIFVSACLAGLIVLWKIHQPAEGQFYNASMRIVYWKTALRMLAAQPLNGVGLGAYGVAFPFFKHAAGENTRLAHGLPWQLAAETGLLGLLTFGGLIASLGLGLRRLARPLESWERRLCVTLALLLLCGLTTIHFDYFLNKLVFMFFAGLLYADAPSRVPLRVTGFTNWIAIPILLTAATLWLGLFQAEQFNAAGSYAAALKLNAYSADSYWGLALRETDPERKRALLAHAWRAKKDPRYVVSADGRTPL